jgi:hypothetical protein
MLNRGPEALDLFKELTDKNPSNIHWQNLKPGSGKPLLPHIDMYREVLRTFLSDTDLDKLSNKKVEFLMAVYPRFLPAGVGTLLAFLVYGLEKHMTGSLHPTWTQRIGFTPLVKGNSDAETISDYIEIVLASSCVPPILPGNGYKGQRVLDGGIIDNVPAYLADKREGRTLVLLSKRYRQDLPSFGTRTYVQPSRPIRIDKFDYANPAGIQETYELGVNDGKTFAASTLK